MKHATYLVFVVVIGALLGSFLGRYIGIYYPTGNVHDLFATNLTAGLNPATLDLSVIEVTFGVLLKFNITSVIGMIVSALLFRGLVK